MRLIAFLLALLFCSSSALAIDLVRVLPKDITQGSVVEVSLTAYGAAAGQSIVIGERLPEGAYLLGWHVDGALEGKGFGFKRDGGSLVWEFTATHGTPVISYSVRMSNGTNATFDAVYASSAQEYGHTKQTVVLLPAPVEQTVLDQEVLVLEEAVTPAVEQPAVSSQTPVGPFVIIGVVLLFCVCLVFVVEIRSRRVAKGLPFGHYTVQYILDAVKKK